MTHRKEIVSEIDEKEIEISKQMEVILPEPDGNVFSTVSVRPDITFDTKNDNENVFILVRGHIITNLWWVIRGFVMAILPPIIFGVFLKDVDSLATLLAAKTITIGIIGWYILTFGFLLIEFLRWFYNVLIITNERLIDIDFNPVLSRRVSEANLENVEDVTENVSNLFSSIFNYGDIEVQTAGEQREFEFRFAPRPSWLRDKLMDLASVRKKLLEN